MPKQIATPEEWYMRAEGALRIAADGRDILRYNENDIIEPLIAAIKVLAGRVAALEKEKK